VLVCGDGKGEAGRDVGEPDRGERGATSDFCLAGCVRSWARRGEG
jgi:hypothetical protein